MSCMMFEDILEQEDTDCRLRAVSSIEVSSFLQPTNQSSIVHMLDGIVD